MADKKTLRPPLTLAIWVVSRPFRSRSFASFTLISLYFGNMTQSTDEHRSPGFFKSLWVAFIAFIGTLFRTSPSAAGLPIPATAKSPKFVNVNTNEAATRPSPAAKVVHQRTSLPATAWVKEPRPLKHRTTTTAARSRLFSMTRPTPPRRSRSVTPKLMISHPEPLFHPPASPFPNISLSGIFATPPSSPPMITDTGIGRFTFPSSSVNQEPTHVFSPGSPPPFHISPSSIKENHGTGTSPSTSVHSKSPHTPTMPTSAVVIRLDPGTLSPTTMSDGSLEIISLGDDRGFSGSPIKVPGVERLPSPWSPVGRFSEEDMWMSVGGVLMRASGPANNDITKPADESIVLKPIVYSSGATSSSVCSTTSDLDSFDISVFVNLGGLDDDPPNEDKDDAKGDPTKSATMAEASDSNRSALDSHDDVHTPRKRRDTSPSVSHFRTPINNTSRTPKCLSTPLTKLEKVDLNHFRSASSISSLAYEFRLGLLGEGRNSMTAFENIISFLEQDSTASIPSHIVRGSVEVPVAGLVEAV